MRRTWRPGPALAIDNALAYRRAYEANRLKDEFLATLSHELRTPLNAILGYAQMLSTGVLRGERQAHAVDRADPQRRIAAADHRRRARRVAHHVRQAPPERRARWSCSRFVQERRGHDAAGRRREGRRPAGDDGRGHRAVSGDPDRLQQVVWNLLSNAVKFTPRGGHVRVRLDRSDSCVELVVADDGQGIEPAFLPHIFERFRQADSRFSREHGGLGLGLAIVRELVELHGGTVSATSDGPGTGATFTVSLPSMLAHRGSTTTYRGAAAADRGR